MNKIMLFVVMASTSLFGIDKFYLQGGVGHVGLTGSGSRVYNNTIGFSLGVGVYTRSNMKLLLDVLGSSHSGGDGLTVINPSLGPEITVIQTGDLEVNLDFAPSFYFYRALTTHSHFGIRFGASIDLVVDDQIRMGLGSRYHSVFDGRPVDDLWTTFLRFVYVFDNESSNP